MVATMETEVRRFVTKKNVVVETTLTNAECINILQGLSNDFAKKLLQDYRRYGRLFNDQWAWAHKLANESILEAMGVTAEKVNVEIENIRKLFEVAKPNLKSGPSITFSLNEGTVKLTASVKPHHHGAIWVSNGEKYHSPANILYGKITAAGVFEPARSGRCPDWVPEFLQEFGSDPKEYAIRYGRKAGACCFCNLKLTDPVSQALGYGKTCAGHYGLPHGKSALAELEMRPGVQL